MSNSKLPLPIASILKISFSAIQENKYFFYCFFLFILIGGIALSEMNQGDLLLYFSANRSPLLDFYFVNFTKIGEEFSYFAFAILFVFIRFRFVLLVPLTGIIVTIISFLGKSFFLHPRPSVYYKGLGTFKDINVVEGIHVVSGHSSFPSGHTMSAFALLALVALLTKNKNILGVFLFFCALMVGLSRVYLVQHFFEDIYLGAIIGVIIALLIYSIQALFPINTAHWIDRKYKSYKL